jgi:protein SCO1/2
MKKYLVSLVLVVTLTVVAVFYVNFAKVTYSKGKNVFVSEIKSSTDMPNKKDLCCVEDLHPAKYSDNSIYQLSSIWKSQNNNKVKLSELYGKQVILAMIYTSCPTACPIIVNNMQKLESAIPNHELKNYRFVLVSIDPKRDTPGQLKKFAEEKNLNQDRWTLLTGSTNDISELSQAIGFRYKESRPGLFTHSNLITFINPKGEIINQSEGLNVNKDALITSLNK